MWKRGIPRNRSNLLKATLIIAAACAVLFLGVGVRTRRFDVPLPSITSVRDIIIAEHGDGFPVHIVRLYSEPPNGNSHSFCWTECLSILSILLYVRPSRVYIHTNYPDYWPFNGCYMITSYFNIHFIYARPRLILNGKPISSMRHEADLVKFTAVYKYGGLATDVDVFFLPNMIPLIDKWRSGQHECLLSQESHFINNGFIACRKGHPYIQEVLTHYQHDYREDSLLHNSGDIPFEIYMNNSHYQQSFYMDTEMANHPFQYRGPIRYKELAAWHSFYHECKDNYANTLPNAVNLTLWEIFHFIHAEGWKRFQFPTTPVPTTVVNDKLLELRLLNILDNYF